MTTLKKMYEAATATYDENLKNTTLKHINPK